MVPSWIGAPHLFYCSGDWDVHWGISAVDPYVSVAPGDRQDPAFFPGAIARGAILWMNEILHHLRDPGMMIPL